MFLEFLPHHKQWLLTLLSAWWAVGQVVGTAIVWPLALNFACPTQVDPMDVASGRLMCLPGTQSQNKGWRWAMLAMGGLVLVLCFIRTIIFPLAESPKWLASQGRDEEAIECLNVIAKMNGTVNPLSVQDMRNIAKKFGVESHAKMPTMVIVKRTFSELGWGHVKPLFATRLIATNTSLLILIYAVIGLAYPLFNGFLGIYLTDIPGSSPNEAYAGYAIQAACGVPGSILAAALVEWKVTGKWSFIAGRRGAMAMATFFSGAFLFAFTAVKTRAQVTAMNSMASFFESESNTSVLTSPTLSPYS